MGRIGRLIGDISAQGFDRYHTPGHKGARHDGDLTELGISGEIFPADAVSLAQEDTAKLYGAQRVRYLTAGSSMGIKAALYAFRGKKVLYSQGVHRAFTEACELWNIQAVPTRGEHKPGLVYTCACGDLPAPATCEEIECALEAEKDAVALFITSPDYFGRVADARICDICKAHGVALIADSAHGAHFAFAPGLEKYRFEHRANACNMSAHKTLGAYTQSALLAFRAEEEHSIEHALALLGTTSPNYAAFARLEDSVNEAADNRAEYLRLKRFSAKLHERADCMENADYTRICVRAKGGDAQRAFAFFTERKIMPEAAIGEYAVFILTPYDTDDKLARLEAAVAEI